MPSVNEALQDRAIQHAILLGRYGSSLAAKLLKLLNSADEDIVATIAARLAAIEERGYDLGPATLKRLSKLRMEIAALNSAIYGQLGEALTSELTEFATAEASYQRDALKASLIMDMEVALPSGARLAAIVTHAPMEGRLLNSWVEGMERGRIDRMDAAIRLGMVQGETTDQIVRRIRGTKALQYQDGVLAISRRSAQSVVRTSVNHVSNVAAQTTWAANSNIVKAWQFVGTLDSRTTITCASLDGKTFPIGEGPIPPRHVGCRSITVAVTKSFRELDVDQDELTPSQRASMDGQVAGTSKFKDWLLRKGETTQEQVLGKTRADLFRSGKLDLVQFVRSDGTLLTLEQLTASYPSILG
jgi:SPP1 gp7 family putative phage head morphogenesis protein